MHGDAIIGSRIVQFPVYDYSLQELMYIFISQFIVYLQNITLTVLFFLFFFFFFFLLYVQSNLVDVFYPFIINHKEEAIQRHPQSLPQRLNIPTESWEQTAQDRAKWRDLIRRGVIVNMTQKESAKPSRNVHSGKPELRHHQQSCLALTSVVPSATDSLELESV